MKNKLLQNWGQCLLTAVAAVLMVSCQSDAYYKECAVDKAREYLLDNSRELSQVQREYIKFNKPVLLHEPIFEQGKKVVNQYQVCITWLVPGEPEAFLVFGSGNYHMRDWSPGRIIRKQFINKEKDKIAAMKNAVAYAMNNMLFLSDTTRNHIRFATPKFAMTNFALDKQGLIAKTDEFGKAKSAKSIAKAKKTLANKEQVSLIYSNPEGNEKIVIVGLSGVGLSGWQTVTGLIASEEELTTHTQSFL